MSTSLEGTKLGDLKKQIEGGLDLKGILGDTPVLVFRPAGDDLAGLLFHTPAEGDSGAEPAELAGDTSVFSRKGLQTAVYAQPGALVVPLTPSNRNLYEGQVLVGRGRQNDVRLVSKEISKSHATFTHAEGEGWTITDLGSSNGTSVNGTPLEADRPYRLRPSDEIELAELAAVFLDPQALVALTTMLEK